jgi:hypothetical protein
MLFSKILFPSQIGMYLYIFIDIYYVYVYIYIHKLYALFVDGVSTVVSRFAPAKILNGHFFSLKSILSPRSTVQPSPLSQTPHLSCRRGTFLRQRGGGGMWKLLDRKGWKTDWSGLIYIYIYYYRFIIICLLLLLLSLLLLLLLLLLLWLLCIENLVGLVLKLMIFCAHLHTVYVHIILSTWMAVLSFDRILNWYSNTVMLCPSRRRPHQECVSVLRASEKGLTIPYLGVTFFWGWWLNTHEILTGNEFGMKLLACMQIMSSQCWKLFKM